MQLLAQDDAQGCLTSKNKIPQAWREAFGWDPSDVNRRPSAYSLVRLAN